MSNDDFLNKLKSNSPKKKQARKKRDQVINPIEQIAPSTVRSVAHGGKEPSRAGNYIRQQTLIEPELRDEINRLVRVTGISKMKLLRVIVKLGVQAIHDGALDDITRTREVVEVSEPDWRKK